MCCLCHLQHKTIRIMFLTVRCSEFKSWRIPCAALLCLPIIIFIAYFLWIDNEHHWIITAMTLHDIPVRSVQNLTLHKSADIFAVNRTFYRQWFGSALHDFQSHDDNMCNIPSLFFLWHHKSGGYFKDWIPIIGKDCNAVQVYINYWNEITKTQWDPMRVDSNVVRNASRHLCVPVTPSCLEQTMQEMNESWNAVNVQSDYHDNSVLVSIQERDVDALLASTILFDSSFPNKHRIIIMMVRKPLDSILSGYNYHSMGNEKGWTDSNVTTYRRKGIVLQQCFRDVWDQQMFLIDGDTTMYKEYRKGFVNNYSDHEALQFGLYLEFTRFVNCEWPMQSGMYKEIKNNGDGKYKWFLFLRFEWFQEYDYRQSMMHFLDQITFGSIDSGNIDLIRHTADGDRPDGGFGCRATNSEAKCRQRNKRAHATQGSYDKRLQTELLMSKDSRIYGMLRNMTLMMDGHWETTASESISTKGSGT